MIVADGMGGHSAGAIASSSAIRSLLRELESACWLHARSFDSSEQSFVEQLQLAIDASHSEVTSAAATQEHPMGTTMTVACIIGTKLFVAHVGDSRCYLLRDGELQQLTTDHTIAQRMLDGGMISDQDARESRWRNVMWNCVGGRNDSVFAEVKTIALNDQDRILLCSDGLTGMVDDEVLASIISDNDTSNAIVGDLISKANSQGGRDNITAVLCICSDASPLEF